jgi:UDP-glucose 4-epimerase
MTVFGRDYPTPDVNCIRDYIHVTDLCDAHWHALQQLRAGSLSGAQAFNLGNGQGYSVQEVIAAAERVTGQTIPVVDAPRRAGDPARLVADSQQARQLLGWAP